MESSSFTGSFRRAKARGTVAQVAQVAHCLVDGCNADLSLCRDYHRRHKVCEIHSKSAKVTIGGRELRFCQQCSRFHSLAEFDDGKRSCRKRLDGHNRRRRKPQPDSLFRNSGRILAAPGALDGARLLSFRSPQPLPSDSLSSSWAGVVKAENDTMLYINQQQTNYIERQNLFPDCSARSYRGVNQLQFACGGDCEPLLDSLDASGSTYSSQKMLCDRLYQVINSDHALSLLSPTPSLSREFGFEHLEQFEPCPQPQALFHNLHCSGLNQHTLSQDNADCGNSSTFTSSKTSQHQHEGSTTSGSHQTPTFIRE